MTPAPRLGPGLHKSSSMPELVKRVADLQRKLDDVQRALQCQIALTAAERERAALAEASAARACDHRGDRRSA
jgi:hypothetical protein